MRKQVAPASRTYRLPLVGVVVALGVTMWLIVPAAALAAPPPNDNFANAQVLPGGSSSVTGTTVEATREPGEPGHGDYSVWYRWTPSASGTATIRTCDSDFDTALSVYTGNRVDALALVGRNDDSSACPSFETSRVRFEATAETTYQIAVASTFDEQGGVGLDIELEVPVPPPNDSFEAAAALDGFEDSARGTSENATRESGEPAHAGGGGASVWYRWTARAGGVVVIDTCASGFDTLLGVYTGGSVAGLRRIASADRGCGRQSRVSFFAKRGTTYRIAVDGRAGDTGRVRIDLEQVKPGRYRGRTEFGDGKRIKFKLTRNGKRVKRFTLSQDLDCFRRRAIVGEFRLVRVWLEPMRVRKTRRGGAFSKRVVVRFPDGARLTINVKGTLTPTDRARGRLKAKVRAPGGVTCRNFLFGDVTWRARQR